ncbi:MFS general substrate transporter [Russula brevipes]|nr:MFS general substrate transporter [Russula brevipes]
MTPVQTPSIVSLARVARLDDNSNEETALLPVQSNDAPHEPSPLPRAQISVLVLPWITESIVSHSISPYINQLVRDLPIVGGDGRKVGYYTGIIISLHFAAEAVTALHWNRLSDHIGRKPVLLSCLAGTTISIILFGLSRSFWAIVLSRCLHGALKGNIGLVKCVMADLTDETNIARGFSLLLMTWVLGFVIGPLIGGTLSRPQDHWPHLFSHPFWTKYPYFLPCIVVAACACSSFVIMVLFFKETVIFTPSTLPQPVRTNSDVPQEESSSDPNTASKDTQRPPPLRSVLTRPVLVSIANYAILSLFETVSLALIPLIWSTSVRFGGLSMSPMSIGLWMSAFGCMDGIYQFLVFPYAVARFGPRSIFVASIAATAVVFIMFPLENLARRHAVDRPSVAVWPLILLQLSSLSIQKMGFSAVFMYITSATPNKRSLGATNGLAQTVAAVQRTAAPATADWLFAFSISNNVLGGNFIFVVLLTMVCAGLWISSKLPRNLWTLSNR